MALFAFEDVTVESAWGPILDEVSAAIPDTGLTVVMGPSGAGKSTLLRLCNRLEAPSSGRVRFRGRDVAALDARELRRRVGMVFQRPTLFGGTVRDNLAVGAPGAGDGRYHAVLEQAHVPAGFLDRPAAQLSGGEAQRVCLARTLVTEPEVLLMDEPTSALDRGPRLALERLARELAGGTARVVWVTHALDQAERLADHALVLVGGRVRYDGDMAGLRRSRDPALTAFLRGGDAGDGSDDARG